MASAGTPDPASRNGRDQTIEQVRASGVEFLYLQFVDVAGAIKSVTVPASRLAHAMEHGEWFDGSAIEGSARVAEQDLALWPAPDTFALLPWETKPTGRLICDVRRLDGEPWSADPRATLKLALARAAAAGFAYRLSSEVEFYLFDTVHPEQGRALPTPVDSSGYFETSSSRAMAVVDATTGALDAMGLAVESSHHEVSAGQYEVDLGEMDALRAADAIVALKWALRAYARREGLQVSFMPKPLSDASGSGLHLRQVLVNTGGECAFYDPSAPYQLSETGRQFVAGQLAHARGMCAVLAPLVNSYKRLTGGAEAPARVSWGRVNRGALVRVPTATRTDVGIELRAPDPSANPYLALAVMLAAGLDGIATGAEPPDAVEEAEHVPADESTAERLADPLPRTLGEALDELEWDPVVRDALGEQIFEQFATVKEQEWQAYSRHVSHWELDRYLDSA